MKMRLAEDINLSQEIIDDEKSMQRVLAATNFDKMMEMVKRRENAAKNIPHCPMCYTKQVRLVNWYTDTLKYKCRQCSYPFEKKL